MTTTNRNAQQIVYFDHEGRENLPAVINVLKRKFKIREELRSLKLIIFTRAGEGPLMAYNAFLKYDIAILGVTFPESFSAKQADGSTYRPEIPVKLKQFFDGVQIEIIRPQTFPFDPIEGLDGHNQNMRLIQDVLKIFSGGLGMCIQAVLVACDFGHIQPGEQVIAMSSDSAALVTASYSRNFLSKDGLSVNEIFCKPRNLTIARPPKPKQPLVIARTGEEIEVGRPARLKDGSTE